MYPTHPGFFANASLPYLGMAVAWIVIGGIATLAYRTYLHKRYPPKKFGIGFTFYLLERGTDPWTPSTFLDRVAGWHAVINLMLPFKPKFWGRHMLHDLFNLVFWPSVVVQLYMYRKFVRERDREFAAIGSGPKF